MVTRELYWHHEHFGQVCNCFTDAQHFGSSLWTDHNYWFYHQAAFLALHCGLLWLLECQLTRESTCHVTPHPLCENLASPSCGGLWECTFYIDITCTIVCYKWNISQRMSEWIMLSFVILDWSHSGPDLRMILKHTLIPTKTCCCPHGNCSNTAFATTFLTLTPS